MMLLLVFVFVGFCWLTVGAVQFLVCVAIPRLRKFALSAALWWAMWGPCSVALMMLAGMAVVAEDSVRQHWYGAASAPMRLPVALGWGYLVLGMVVTVIVATVAAWVHQAVARRLTFALFRLYAMAVVGGIGSVFGWWLGWSILAMGWRYGWVLGCACMVMLVAGFGWTAYKGARSLRGEAPTTWAIVSREEFDGVEAGS